MKYTNLTFDDIDWNKKVLFVRERDELLDMSNTNYYPNKDFYENLDNLYDWDNFSNDKVIQTEYSFIIDDFRVDHSWDMFGGLDNMQHLLKYKKVINDNLTIHYSNYIDFDEIEVSIDLIDDVYVVLISSKTFKDIGLLFFVLDTNYRNGFIYNTFNDLQYVLSIVNGKNVPIKSMNDVIDYGKDVELTNPNYIIHDYEFKTINLHVHKDSLNHSVVDRLKDYNINNEGMVGMSLILDDEVTLSFTMTSNLGNDIENFKKATSLLTLNNIQYSVSI